MSELAELIRQVEGAGFPSASGGRGRVVPTGWGPVDAHLRGGLACGVVHEWLGLSDDEGDGGWVPPLCILAQLAWGALQASAGCDGGPGRVAWIGRAVWPHGRWLVRGDDRRLLAGSLFVDPPDRASRLWAIDLVLRCPAVCAVVADGRGLTMAATRRLQLAAESGGGLTLVARPPREVAALTAAATRWRVGRERSASSAPRWGVRVLRLKSSPTSLPASSRDHGVPGAESSPWWALEWDREQSAVVASADVVGGPGRAPETRVAAAGVRRSA
ncbi:MAG: ImuA family protein [Planctomycetota bacterium]